MRAAVVDTRALVWFATGHADRLGRAARAHFRRVDEQRAVAYIPAITLVEVLDLVRLGHVKLPMPASQWLEALLSTGSIAVADLTLEIALAAHELYAVRERADRLITATARALALPLITADAQVRESGVVDVIW